MADKMTVKGQMVINFRDVESIETLKIIEYNFLKMNY